MPLLWRFPYLLSSSHWQTILSFIPFLGSKSPQESMTTIVGGLHIVKPLVKPLPYWSCTWVVSLKPADGAPRRRGHTPRSHGITPVVILCHLPCSPHETGREGVRPDPCWAPVSPRHTPTVTPCDALSHAPAPAPRRPRPGCRARVVSARSRASTLGTTAPPGGPSPCTASCL